MRAYSEGVLLEEERWLAQGGAEAVATALGLQPSAGSSEKYWLESLSEEEGGTDGTTGVVVNRSLGLSAPKMLLSVDERLALITQMEAEGAIDAAIVADLKLRMAERRSRAPRERLSPYARSFLDGLRGDSATAVVVCGHMATRAMIPEWALYHEIVHGFDRDAARDIVAARREERRASVAALQEEVIQVLPEGIEVERSMDLPCVHTVLTAAEISDIAWRAPISHVYVGVEAVTSGDEEANGVQTRQGIQAKIYLDNNDVGGIAPSKSNSFNRLTVAVNDSGMNEQHRAFKDAATGSRIVGQFTCGSGTSCTSTSGVTAGTANHGTRVMATIGGDLLDGQDANHTSGAARQERSGYANEVGFVLLDGVGPSGSFRAANTAIAEAVDIVNLSAGVDRATCQGDPDPNDNNYTVDAKCRGESTVLNDAINLAFDDGIFYVKSAGNEGPSTASCTCTVTAPGDAEGAFVVGALNETCADGDQAVVRAATIASYSSEGGGELGGWPFSTRERSVVSMAAPSSHHNLATCTAGSTCDTTDLSQYGCTNIGTSFSAPIVSAAAAMYKDRWITWGSPTTWLDNAGNMRIQMLLMGDRLDNNGTSRRTTGYATKYGAGRLKMRHRSDAGMDAPWLARSGFVDIEDGEVFQRWVSSDATAVALSSDVNLIKTVAWWFEPGTVDLPAYITLQVQMFQADCATHISTVTDGAADTRKHVFRNDLAGGRCLRLQITGIDVPTGETRRVYWGYYFEDSDRDDLNGPDLNSPVLPDDVELP